MVYRRGDAMGVVGGETEAVVLLEALIGPHAERGQGSDTMMELEHMEQSWKHSVGHCSLEKWSSILANYFLI